MTTWNVQLRYKKIVLYIGRYMTYWLKNKFKFEYPSPEPVYIMTQEWGKEKNRKIKKMINNI
jgi:hypothetical protein